MQSSLNETKIIINTYRWHFTRT